MAGEDVAADPALRALSGFGPVGFAGRSALSAFDLAPGSPSELVVACPSRPPGLPSRVRVRGGEPGLLRRRARLCSAEMTLLEAFRTEVWSRLAESEPVAFERLLHHVAVGSIRPDRLVEAAAADPAAVRRRVEMLARTVAA